MKMVLMSEAHRHNLNRNRVKLTKHVQSLPSIFEFLRQDYTLTAEMQEEIEAVRSHDRQVGKLLDVLSRRSDKAFERFVHALVHTHQDDLAVILDPNTAKHLIETRNCQLQSDSQPAVMRSDPPQPMFIATNHVIGASNPAAVLPVMLVQTNAGLPAPQPTVMAVVQTVPQVAYSPDTRPISLQDFRNEVVGSGCALMNITVQPTADVPRLKSTQRIYSMERQPRGRAVIVSNRYFLKSNLELRDGAEFDETNICRLFTALHFSVQLYTNKSGSEMRTVLENERRSYIHQCADAFVLVLLTHGSRGSVFGIDGEKVPIDEITTLFDGSHCPQLRNKPKLFFVQACQGHKKSSRYQLDGPANVQPSDAVPLLESGSEAAANLSQQLDELSIEDTAGYVPPLPSISDDQHEKADMLIAYATVKGYEAWRHAELGSWFVRTLVYVFQRHAHRQNVVEMLTEANFLMSKLETEGTLMPYRQVAEKTDTFLKQLYFLPGYSAAV